MTQKSTSDDDDLNPSSGMVTQCHSQMWPVHHRHKFLNDYYSTWLTLRM